MPKYTSIYLNGTRQRDLARITKELDRLGISQNSLFNSILPHMAARLQEMKHKHELFNGNFGPIRIR